jgi:hypothetical protein
VSVAWCARLTPHTAGCTFGKTLDTPGYRVFSKWYSRQYHSADSLAAVTARAVSTQSVSGKGAGRTS